jgi:hypothetical protein
MKCPPCKHPKAIWSLRADWICLHIIVDADKLGQAAHVTHGRVLPSSKRSKAPLKIWVAAKKREDHLSAL